MPHTKRICVSSAQKERVQVSGRLEMGLTKSEPLVLAMDVLRKASKRAFRLPISVRLTLWYGLSMLVLLGLFSGLMITTYHWNQHSLLHQRLFNAQSELLQDIDLEEGVPRLSPALGEREDEWRLGAPFGIYARLLSPGGAVWDQSANFEDRPAFRPLLPTGHRLQEVDLDWQGQPFRTMYVPVEQDERVAGWLEVSAQAPPPMHYRGAGWPVVGAMLITVLLGLLGGYFLARRALRPVVRLTAAANQINASALNIRLPADAQVRDELTDLAETFNTMLARLEASFERERRFTANAAHELLNPLASVQNEAEVTLRRPRTALEYQQTLRTILADAQRLGRLVEQLLDLARLEAGTEQQREAVDVAALCRQHLAPWKDRATRCQIALQFEGGHPVCVAVRAAHLETVLDNLLENAFKYTPAGRRVQVKVIHDQQHALLSVADTGIGFEPGTAERLFDRFYRAETAEVQAQSGNGLGLAIVQAIVRAYGGTLQATSGGLGEGSTFTVRFPLKMEAG